MVVLTHAKSNTLKPRPASSVRSDENVGSARRRRITNADRERIMDLYGRGLTTREVAAELKLGRTTVLNQLKKSGSALRPRGGQVKP